MSEARDPLLKSNSGSFVVFTSQAEMESDPNLILGRAALDRCCLKRAAERISLAHSASGCTPASAT